MAEIDHINIDLDGDGIKERYELSDQFGRKRDDTLQSLITTIYSQLLGRIDDLKKEFTNQINTLTGEVDSLKEDVNSLKENSQWKFLDTIYGSQNLKITQEFKELYIMIYMHYDDTYYGLSYIYVDKTIFDETRELLPLGGTNIGFIGHVDNNGDHASGVMYVGHVLSDDVLIPLVSIDRVITSDGTNITADCRAYIFYR